MVERGISEALADDHDLQQASSTAPLRHETL